MGIGPRRSGVQDLASSGCGRTPLPLNGAVFRHGSMKVPQPPEANIGMFGHVDRGKGTLTQCLTDTWTELRPEGIGRGMRAHRKY